MHVARLATVTNELFLTAVEELVCYPWFTVTRATYTTGSAYEMVCCDITEADDYDVFFNSILPAGGVLLDVSKTQTLGAAEVWERTVMFWTSE